jgi:hypothetical protein
MRSLPAVLAGPALAFVVLIAAAPPAHASWLGGVLKGVQNVVTGSGGSGALADSEIAGGLQEALRLGTERAVAVVSKDRGYLDNARIAIPLPESVRKAEKILRVAGFGTQLDEFKMSMNRAAEKAAPQATAVFADAIKQMTFDDVRRIWKGPDDAATAFFKEKTSPRLTELFKPMVTTAMSEVNVTGAYQGIETKVKSIPFAGELLPRDLEQYVTGKALDGLFVMLADEERRIRQDPAARATDLLKRVFGTR